ncbi:MAG: cupin domain-containing protein [Paucibacter sp.]|nr:cupin domain-containing protein [Roseateles sp.]
MATNPTTLPAALRALDITPPAIQTGYPEPFASQVAGRVKRRLGDAFGLTNFGVNLCRLAPGAVSSMRHSHSAEDEFVYVLQGHPSLLTDAGLTTMSPGDCAGFKADASSKGDAHQLRNDSAEEVVYLEVGARTEHDDVVYPDDDLALIRQDGRHVFTHKDGRPYAADS